jgi:imidazolonepropionase
MAQLEVIEDGAVLVEGNVVRAVGAYREVRRAASRARREEVQGVLFPGFVDSHTHAVFGAPRLADHERRARGEDYKTIAAAGGGILSSVRDARSRSVAELTRLTQARLRVLLSHGTTTVEVKSGYGLSTDSELNQLRAIGALREPPFVVPTFLGAHEVPPEFRSRPDDYVNLVTTEMLPAVAEQGIARFCDVFCEPGVFTVAQTRRILRRAAELGLGLKLHADELDPSGGAELAAELEAASADHLAAVSDAGVAALARSSTVAVLLPGTMLFLGKSGRAPARKLVDAGAAVALATDFNPGSSPGMSLPLMAMLGVSQLGLTPAEAVMAITVNGAAALGEASRRGQLAPGFRADLVLTAAADWREVPYWYGVNLVRRVWVGGSACHPRGLPVIFGGQQT